MKKLLICLQAISNKVQEEINKKGNQWNDAELAESIANLVK